MMPFSPADKGDFYEKIFIGIPYVRGFDEPKKQR